MAIAKRSDGQGAEGDARGVVGKEEMLLQVGREDILYGYERNRGIENEEIGELIDRAGEKGEIGEQVEDIPEDGDR